MNYNLRLSTGLVCDDLDYLPDLGEAASVCCHAVESMIADIEDAVKLYEHKLDCETGVTDLLQSAIDFTTCGILANPEGAVFKALSKCYLF